MSSIDLLLLGSGGHCKVLIELAKLLGYKKFWVFDDVLIHPFILLKEFV